MDQDSKIDLATLRDNPPSDDTWYFMPVMYHDNGDGTFTVTDPNEGTTVTITPPTQEESSSPNDEE